MDHTNILKFHNWYETRNHLWLIFEYCPGGALFTLIEQDKKLPEATIREFAKDLIVGLLFLHSHGIIFGDLKPSNLLLNEFGTVKFADFGFAHRIVDLVLENQEEGKPKRGTPFYMAPELYQDSGVYSFYSDFWALGCVLYELAVGQPPFASESFQELLTQIVSQEVPPVADASVEFNQLLTDLLEKDPAQRISWPELLSHPFWGSAFVGVEAMLPEQPHYDRYLRDRGVAQRSLAKSPFKQKGMDPQIDMVRLSLNVQKNMLRQSQKEGYSTSEALIEGKPQDVRLKNRDQEVDFTIPKEEEEQEGEEEEENHPTEEDAARSELNIIEEEKAPSKKIRPISAPVHNPQAITAPRPPPVQILEEDSRPSSTNAHQRTLSTPQPDTPSKSTFRPLPLDQVIVHQSDITVKPIVGNRDIERSESVANLTNLPIRMWTTDEITSRCDRPEFEAHLNEIYTAIEGSQINDRVNILNYFEQTIINSNIANRVINSLFVGLLLKLLKTTRQPVLKTRICSIFGQMIRHATVIDIMLANSGMVQTLSELLKDQNEKTKRKAMAALGEFLFYSATQMDEEGSDPAWDIPKSLLQLVVRCLRAGEDEIVRFYAVKTVENILAQSKVASLRLSTPDLCPLLASIYLTSKQELMKTSAIVGLSHLVRLNPALIPVALERLTLRNIVTALSEGQARIQQALLTLLLFVFQDPGQRAMTSLLEDKAFIPTLIALLENPGIVIRGKSLLVFMMLFKANPKLMAKVADLKFYSIIERVNKDTFKYIQSCLYYLVDAIGEISLRILTDMAQDLTRSSRTSLSLAPVLLHVINCAPVKARFPYKNYIVSLSALIRSGLSDSQNEEFQRVLILILESLSSNPKALSANAEVLFSNLLPELLMQQRNPSSQTRFMCLKIFSDILITMLTDDAIYDPNSSKVYTQSANELITKSLLPLYSQLLADEEPIPLYAIKLLSVVLEQIPQMVSVLHRLNLVGLVIQDFHADSRRLNAHLVKSVKKIVESKELSLADFQRFGLVEKVGTVMEMVQQKDQDWCIESLLNIVYELLFCTADLLRKENSETTLAFAEPLVNWFPLCVKFMTTGELSVKERSMHCVALMLQLYGKTHTGFLLSKQPEKFLAGEYLTAMVQLLGSGLPQLQLRTLKVLRRAFGGSGATVDWGKTRKALEMLVTHEDRAVAQLAL